MQAQITVRVTTIMRGNFEGRDLKECLALAEMEGRNNGEIENVITVVDHVISSEVAA